MTAIDVSQVKCHSLLQLQCELLHAAHGYKPSASHPCRSLVLLLKPTAFLTEPSTDAMTPLDLTLLGGPEGGSWEPALPCTGAEGLARLDGPRAVPECPGDSAVFSRAADDCTGAEGRARFGGPATESCAVLAPAGKHPEELHCASKQLCTTHYRCTIRFAQHFWGVDCALIECAMVKQYDGRLFLAF